MPQGKEHGASPPLPGAHGGKGIGRKRGRGHGVPEPTAIAAAPAPVHLNAHQRHTMEAFMELLSDPAIQIFLQFCGGHKCDQFHLAAVYVFMLRTSMQPQEMTTEVFAALLDIACSVMDGDLRLRPRIMAWCHHCQLRFRNMIEFMFLEIHLLERMDWRAYVAVSTLEDVIGCFPDHDVFEHLQNRNGSADVDICAPFLDVEGGAVAAVADAGGGCAGAGDHGQCSASTWSPDAEYDSHPSSISSRSSPAEMSLEDPAAGKATTSAMGPARRWDILDWLDTGTARNTQRA